MPGSDKNDDGLAGFPDLGDAIDSTTFGQILEMDEDDGEEKFSQSIVFGFFDQAEETFKEMDVAMADKDLEKLSQLGHFLKGSSATLGLIKVRDACEKIQRFGKCENLDGSPEPDKALCLARIKETLPALRGDYADVEKTLRNFYGDSKT